MNDDDQRQTPSESQRCGACRCHACYAAASGQMLPPRRASHASMVK